MTPFTIIPHSFESEINNNTVSENKMKQQKKQQLYPVIALWIVTTVAAIAGLKVSGGQNPKAALPASPAVSYNTVKISNQ